jgi:hypothetical protein
MRRGHHLVSGSNTTFFFDLGIEASYTRFAPLRDADGFYPAQLQGNHHVENTGGTKWAAMSVISRADSGRRFSHEPQ